jgi:hypothetical protein
MSMSTRGYGLSVAVQIWLASGVKYLAYSGHIVSFIVQFLDDTVEA